MKTILTKTDIDGHKIQRVLQTPFEETEWGTACRLFVELDNGVLFELVSDDVLEETGLQQADLRDDLILAQFPEGAENCIGETVNTLVSSGILPTIAVQIMGDRMICLAASGPNYVGPFIVEIEPHYSGEIFSYWTKELIKS